MGSGVPKRDGGGTIIKDYRSPSGNALILQSSGVEQGCAEVLSVLLEGSAAERGHGAEKGGTREKGPESDSERDQLRGMSG